MPAMLREQTAIPSIESFRSGRHREWRVNLENAGTAPHGLRAHKEFIPDLAVIHIGSPAEDADFDSVRVFLSDKKNGSISYTSESLNPQTSLRCAPSCVHRLVADVTGHGHLINAYSGSRFFTAEDADRMVPPVEAYPAPAPVPSDAERLAAIDRLLRLSRETGTVDSSELRHALTSKRI